MDLSRLRGRKVTVVEVGPRDGLQNESAVVSTADKIAFVDRLSAANLPVIEVSAFVSPKWVPQMADAAEVFAGIARRPGIRYTALVPNLAGLDRALAAGVSEIAIFAAASETFSRMNINQSIADSLATYKEVCQRALAAGLRVRGYLSTAFGCPYEGEVPPSTVATVASRLIELGVFEVAISDTIGIAHPGQVPLVLDAGIETDSHRSRRAAFPRHARHRACQRAGGAGGRHRDLRRLGWRPGRLPVCARSGGQPRHRRPYLHAERIGNRDRRVASDAVGSDGVHCGPSWPPAAVAVRAGSSSSRSTLTTSSNGTMLMAS